MGCKRNVRPFGRGHGSGAGLRRALALGAALALCVPALCGWVVGSEVEIVNRYYSIRGADHAELVDSVRRNAPMGGHAYGLGYIDFYPRYRTGFDSGKRRIVAADVGLRVVLQLPRWDGAPDGPRKVAGVARRFARAIEAHEMQHVGIARAYARRMRTGLLRLAPDTSCWTLTSRAEALIRDFKERHVESQKAFDRRVHRQIRRLL